MAMLKNASIAGVGWLHYWIDEKKGFCYGVIPSMQVRPVYSLRLEKELEAVLRTYRMVDDNGDEWQIYEIWNDKECQSYRKRAEMFQPFDMFSYVNLDGMAEPTRSGMTLARCRLFRFRITMFALAIWIK